MTTRSQTIQVQVQQKSPLKPHQNIDNLHKSIDGQKFESQVTKFAHHHSLPGWASSQLKNHIQLEVKRRDKVHEFDRTWHNLLRPWRWRSMWHIHHIAKGDIKFPEDEAHHHSLSQVSLPTPKPKSSLFSRIFQSGSGAAAATPSVTPTSDKRAPPSPAVNVKTALETVPDKDTPNSKAKATPKVDAAAELESLEEGVIFMTEDLVEEILNDNVPDDDHFAHEELEHAGAAPISPWASLGELESRSYLFAKDPCHENTIRSLALCNPKPGDPRPGKTKLCSARNIGFVKYMTCTVYDERRIATAGRGVIQTKTIKLKDCKKKCKKRY